MLGNLLRLGAVEQGAVDVDAETPCLGGFDGANGDIIGARLANGFVMLVAPAIQMDVPGKGGVRLVAVELLFQQQGVGAQINAAALIQQPLDDLFHILVEQGLATGDADHRSAAFTGGFQAIGNRQSGIQNLVRVIDLAATGTRQITAE